MKWKYLDGPEAGFTLLEVMITLIIMSISLIALAGLQVHAIRGNTYSKRLTTAVTIGQAKLEQIKNTAYANVQSESSTQITVPSGGYNMDFTRQVTVTNNTNPANTKTVKVTVTWTQASKSYTVPMVTLLSQ
jgi:prepilin-type N-terminal cleavage/methylation domain-containing protein